MRRSLRSWLWRVPVDEEVDEELTFHLEMRTRELIAQGLSPEAAREQARARLGDIHRLRHTCIDIGRKRDREMRLTQWLEEVRDDVRFALRQMRRAPGFTVTAVLTLALGIGANSAIFALVDATLLRPLPFPNAERLVAVWERFGDIPRAVVSPLNFRDWNERNQTFEGMTAYLRFPRQITATDGTAEQIAGQQVTARYFDVLGITPLLGRTFVTSDVALPPNVVVISEGLWASHFGHRSDIVGTSVRLDGQPFTIVGVVPETFATTVQSQVWTVWMEPPGMDARALHFMSVIGRLRPHVPHDAGRADLERIAAQLATDLPATNKGRGVTMAPLREALIGQEIRLTAVLFLVVVGFVLLICCANLANLLLTRMAGRSRELAVRTAIGAGRRRVVGQILIESLVLALFGGAIGLALGAAIVRAAPAAIPQGLLPSVVHLAIDGRIVAFCGGTSLAVGLLFGLGPAWQATGASLLTVLTSEGRGTTSQRSGALRRLLVVAELAMAVLLLCGAGLLLRTLFALGAVDTGYRIDNALTMQLSLSYGLPTSRYKSQDELLRFYDAVEREVQALPGVRRAAWASTAPLGGVVAGGTALEIVGHPPVDPADRPLADYQIVSPGYFDTLAIPLRAGRGFDNRDTAASPQVCIVSDSFARRFARGGNVVGMRIAMRPLALGPSRPVEREIVGVVPQIKAFADEADDALRVYVPNAQNTWNNAVLVVTARDGSPDRLARSVRTAIAQIDPGQPVTRVLTLSQIVHQATERQRFRAVLVGTFAGLALLLAMIGVFGVLAYSVEQRTREFGVRIALGASTRDVLALVLGSAARMIGTGAAIGLVAALLLGRLVTSFLYGVRPFDPTTFAAVAAVTIVTALAAVTIPAFRASRTDPVAAFRLE